MTPPLIGAWSVSDTGALLVGAALVAARHMSCAWTLLGSHKGCPGGLFTCWRPKPTTPSSIHCRATGYGVFQGAGAPLGPKGYQTWGRGWYSLGALAWRPPDQPFRQRVSGPKLIFFGFRGHIRSRIGRFAKMAGPKSASSGGAESPTVRRGWGRGTAILAGHRSSLSPALARLTAPPREPAELRRRKCRLKGDLGRWRPQRAIGTQLAI